MEKTKKKTDLVVMLDDFKKIKELEERSALTIEGFMIDDKEEVRALLKFFEKALVKKDPTIYCIKGDIMNRYLKLNGKNRYEDDLNIVVIGLDNFNMTELMELRLAYFGLFRWLDDVCDNNRRRNK